MPDNRGLLTPNEVEGLMYQIAGKSNWEAVYEVPSWLAIHDRMPTRMKLAFELKLQGYTTKEIAEQMSISARAAYYLIGRAKKYILTSLVSYG